MIFAIFAAIFLIAIMFYFWGGANFRDEQVELIEDLKSKRELESPKKLNFCVDCKFQRGDIYSNPKCINEGVLKKTHDYLKLGAWTMKKPDRKDEAIRILTYGFASCSACRLVVGSNCSHFVKKEEKSNDES